MGATYEVQKWALSSNDIWLKKKLFWIFIAPCWSGINALSKKNKTAKISAFNSLQG